MAKKEENTGKEVKVKRKRTIKAPLNDGMNTPVPNNGPVPAVSEEEAALFKQAENPLGDPHKI
jgi:hypothetical protein